MDPDTALQFVKHGATLLLLNVPQHTLIGIDTQMFAVGPVFIGIKMIPPGCHFVYYSSTNRDGNKFSPVTGFFIDVCASEVQLLCKPGSSVIVRRWDEGEEQLVKLSEEEEERYCQSVKKLEFDRQLGPYALSQYEDWKRLSNYITKSVIERIEPIGGEITVACEPDTFLIVPTSAIEKAFAEQVSNSKFATPVGKSERRGCYYTAVPRIVKRKGICSEELTSLNHDKTQLLETILVKEYGCSEELLLGELQFAFIAFLMGQSLEGFLQWKSLVSLLFGCIDAPFRTRSQLFTKFIKVIYHQLKYALQGDHKDAAEKGPSAFIDDSWFTTDSFLHHLCKDFFSLLGESSVVNGDLLTWTRELQKLLENTLGWDFQQKNAEEGMYFDSNDEYAPVVEMLDS